VVWIVVGGKVWGEVGKVFKECAGGGGGGDWYVESVGEYAREVDGGCWVLGGVRGGLADGIVGGWVVALA